MSTEKKVTLLSAMPEELQAEIRKEVIAELKKEKEKKENEVSPEMKQYIERKNKTK